MSRDVRENRMDLYEIQVSYRISNTYRIAHTYPPPLHVSLPSSPCVASQSPDAPVKWAKLKCVKMRNDFRFDFVKLILGHVFGFSFLSFFLALYSFFFLSFLLASSSPFAVAAVVVVGVIIIVTF